MNPWIAKSIILVAIAVMVIIRAPHGQRSRTIKIVRSGNRSPERVVLALAGLGFLVPFLWIATPILAFADYSLHVVPLISGSMCLALGLWLFYRSHSDLGTNWSITLQVRENHSLVTRGVYTRVRHPMYLALLLYSVGQTLVLPNWIAGPSYLVAMTFLFALRVGAEERMMVEEFGAAYESYRRRTKRLVPGIW
jgi:protein-S-isoprenylcysteine O-methyltransferase Ste14